MRVLGFLVGVGACASVPNPVVSQPPPEVCNGIDDDRDGEVDEGFGDFDGDRVADCIDEACDLSVAVEAAGPVQVCHVAPPPPEPRVIDPTIEQAWRWRDVAGRGVFTTPVVGDVDRDGDLEIVVVGTSGFIVVLDARTGAELSRISGVDASAGVALAQIDADPDLEVLSVDENRRQSAWDIDGRVVWKGEGLRVGTAAFVQPTVVDLEGDGWPEALFDTDVLDARTGGTRFRLAASPPGLREPVPVDLDLDGRHEIVLAEAVYQHDGRLRFALDAPDLSQLGSWVAVAQLDADAEAELVFALGRTLTAVDTDGAVLWTRDDPDRVAGPLCAADLDGDGLTEVVVPRRDVVYAVDDDGADRWVVASSDPSGASACATVDLSGDGVADVVLATEQEVVVFDGVTGGRLIRWSDASYVNATYVEGPIPADLDGDGSLELVVAGSSRHLAAPPEGIRVFRNPLGLWPAGPSHWLLRDAMPDRIEADGTLPRWPALGWRAPGVFRGWAPPYHHRPDLAIVAADRCAAHCADDAPTQLTFAILNTGSATAEDVEVVIEAVGAHPPRELGRIAAGALSPGARRGGITWDLPLADWGSRGVQITVSEHPDACDPDDAVVVLPRPDCP